MRFPSSGSSAPSPQARSRSKGRPAWRRSRSRLPEPAGCGAPFASTRSTGACSLHESATSTARWPRSPRPPRHGQFELRVMVKVRSFGDFRIDEPALLELPLGRAPPQGAVIETVAEVKPPRPPEDGFDERAWLARQGMHVVLHGRPWHQLGRRGGIAGVADRLRGFVSAGVAPGLHGERAAVIAGSSSGADEGLSRDLQDRFRQSGPLSPPGRLRAERRDHRGRDPAARRARRASRAGWERAASSARSQATCSPSGCSRRSSVRESPARSPRSPGLPRARATAGTSCSSPRSRSSPGIRTTCSSPASSSRSRPCARSSCSSRGSERRLEGYPVPRLLATPLAVSDGVRAVHRSAALARLRARSRLLRRLPTRSPSRRCRSSSGWASSPQSCTRSSPRSPRPSPG